MASVQMIWRLYRHRTRAPFLAIPSPAAHSLAGTLFALFVLSITHISTVQLERTPLMIDVCPEPLHPRPQWAELVVFKFVVVAVAFSARVVFISAD